MANTNTSINKNVGGDKTKSSTDDTDTKKGPAFGVDSNTTGGGVWAQTSAKRDKLGELRMELKWDLGQRTLDDCATSEEGLDLFLVDGVRAVVSLVDGKIIKNVNVEEGGSVEVTRPALHDFYLLLEEYATSLAGAGASAGASESEGDGEVDDDDAVQIDRQQFESHLANLLTHVEQIRLHHIAAPPPPGIKTEETSKEQQLQQEGQQEQSQYEAAPSSLIHMRDFLTFEPPKDAKKIPTNLETDLSISISQPLHECIEYFRILLLQACLQDLSTQWDALVKISDADLDRAATTGKILKVQETISLGKVHKVLEAFGKGSCSDRVEAMWGLMDKDHDGLLDQIEMDNAVYRSLAPMNHALKVFVEDCVEVWPMRGGRLPNQEIDYEMQGQGEEQEQEQVKKGRYRKWKEARAEKKAKKIVLKLLDRAIKRHFQIDVEVEHRLRCVYAWAEKKHQDGKLQSVLVDNSGVTGEGAEENGSTASTPPSGGLFTGRQRYVELDPKISYAEFREVQQEHFAHLDKVGEELCTSFKEELWILQGKRRQDAELRREGFAFLAVVGLIDFAIISN